MKHINRLSAFAVAIVCAGILNPTAQGADSSWNVDAAGTWNTAGNWLGSVIPGTTSGSTSPDTAYFNFTLNAARTVTVDAGRNVAGISFGNTSNFGYTLNPGTLVLTNGGTIQTTAGNGNHTDYVQSFITLAGDGGNATFTAGATSASSVLRFGRSLAGASTTGNVTTLTVNGSNTGTNSLNTIMSDGTLGGKLALVKDGSGLWLIGVDNSANLFTGGITINSGTLKTGAASTTGGQGLGAANAITLANTAGAVLDLSTGNLPQTIGTLSGGGNAGGNVSLGVSTFLTMGLNNANATYAGNISGSGQIAKIGTGTQTFSGTNSYTGDTTITGGALKLDFAGGAAPATNIINATSDLVLNGGALIVAGKNSTVNSQVFASTKFASGDSSISALDASGNSLAIDLKAVTRNAGGVADLTLPSGAQSNTHGILTSSPAMTNNVWASGNTALATVGDTWASTSGSNVVSFNGAYSTGNANYTSTKNVDVTNGDSVSDVTVNTLRFNGNDTLTLSGTNTVGLGAVLVTSTVSTGATITGGTLKAGAGKELVLINKGNQLTVNSIIADNATPSVLTLSGPGTTILNGVNTYTGATYINGGTVKVGNSSALGVDSAVVVADNLNATIDLNGNDLAIGSLAGGGGGGTGVTSGQLTVATTGGNVKLGANVLTVGGNNTTTAFGGIISGNGGSIVKVGTGTLTLNGVNTFTGGSTIKAGALQLMGVISSNNAAGGTGLITLGDSAGSAAATLGLGSSGANAGTSTYFNNVLLGATTGALTIRNNAGNTVTKYAGTITGSNDLAFQLVAGELDFTGYANNDGDVNFNISGGLSGNTGSFGGLVDDVVLNSSAGAGSGSILSQAGNFDNHGQLRNIGTGVIGWTITGTLGRNVAGVEQNSPGALVLQAATNLFTGPIAINSGTLTLNGAQTAGFDSAITLANAASTVLLHSTAVGETKVGSLAGGGATGGNVTLSGGGVLAAGTDDTNTTYSGVMSGAGIGGFKKVGSGTMTLTAANSYTGTTTAGNGVLTVNIATGTLASQKLGLTGGTLNVDNVGAAGVKSLSSGTLFAVAGDGGVKITRTAAQDVALKSTGALIRSAGATVNFINTSGSNSATNGFTFTTQAAGLINPGAFYNGADFAYYDATGFVRAGVYGTDATFVNAGASLTANANNQVLSSITGQAAVTVSTIKFAGAGVVDLTQAANTILTGTSILRSGGGSTIISGGTIRGGVNTELLIRTDSASDSLTINSAIVANGANAFTKSGQGTLTLGAANIYTGQTYLNGGVTSISSNANLGLQTTGAALNINNATLRVTADVGLYNGTPGTNNRAVNITNDATFDVTSSNTLRVAGIVSGDGNLTKTSTGTMILSGNNTYTGRTLVSAGTLLINGDQSTARNKVTVGGSGVLGGTGKTGGKLVINGVLAPGASVETFSSADLVFNNGSTFAYEVDSSALVSAGADLQIANGELSLNGTVNLSLTNLNVGNFAFDTTFSLINYNGLWNGGLFTYAGNELANGEIFAFNGQNWRIDYNAVAGGDNFTSEYLPSSNFVNLTVIPEPSTMLLSALGLTVVMSLRRRRA